MQVIFLLWNSFYTIPKQSNGDSKLSTKNSRCHLNNLNNTYSVFCSLDNSFSSSVSNKYDSVRMSLRFSLIHKSQSSLLAS